MTNETKLPDGLELAVAHIEELGSIIATRYADHMGKVHPSRVDRVAREVETCNAAIEAIRAEHAQRLTLQHHAADLAQRAADLEAERDELRARLADLERQEPICIVQMTTTGGRLRYNPDADSLPENGMHLYARPVPAIPAGWRLVNDGALAMVVNALRRDAEDGRPVRGEMADELLAAPEAAR